MPHGPIVYVEQSQVYNGYVRVYDSHDSSVFEIESEYRIKLV
jgi:hypothetical protein